MPFGLPIISLALGKKPKFFSSPLEPILTPEVHPHLPLLNDRIGRLIWFICFFLLSNCIGYASSLGILIKFLPLSSWWQIVWIIPSDKMFYMLQFLLLIAEQKQMLHSSVLWLWGEKEDWRRRTLVSPSYFSVSVQIHCQRKFKIFSFLGEGQFSQRVLCNNFCFTLDFSSLLFGVRTSRKNCYLAGSFVLK